MNKKIIAALAVSCFFSATAGSFAQTNTGSTTTQTTTVTYPSAAVSIAALPLLAALPKSDAVNLRPDNGSYVTTNPPYIFVKMGQAGQSVGINQANFKMLVDGKDVTNFAVVGDGSVSYSPPAPLLLGDHWVKVFGLSNTGERIEQHLAFNVVPAGPTIDLTGAVSSPNVIAVSPYLPPLTAQTTTQTTQTYVMGAPAPGTSTTVTTTVAAVPLVPRNIALSTLDTIKIADNMTSPAESGRIVPIVLLGRPNGEASFDLVPRASFRPAESVSATTQTTQSTQPSMQTVETTPPPVNVTVNAPSEMVGIKMEETSPGTYAALYRVNDADYFNNAMLVGRLNLPTGEALIGSTPTVNDAPFYAMYIGNPLYSTVWIPDIASIGETSTLTTTRSTTMGAPVMMPSRIKHPYKKKYLKKKIYKKKKKNPSAY